jgi:hypothetical protein
MTRYSDFFCLQLTSQASPFFGYVACLAALTTLSNPPLLYIHVARTKLQMQIPDCRTSGKLGTGLEGGTLGTINHLRSPRERRMHGMTSNVSKEENSAEDGQKRSLGIKSRNPQIHTCDFSSYDDIWGDPVCYLSLTLSDCIVPRILRVRKRLREL